MRHVPEDREGEMGVQVKHDVHRCLISWTLATWGGSPSIQTTWQRKIGKSSLLGRKSSTIGLYPPTPLAAGGARQRRNYQQQGPRSHYKQQGQEARKQERRSKKQEAITGNKRQEARNKKPGSNKRLEDRTEKQETRSQEATSGWKTGQRASFLVDSESNVRQAAGRQLRELVFL